MKGRQSADKSAHSKGSERGSAVLVVLTLTLVITALLLTNAMVVHQLRQELHLIEKKQESRYAR